MAGAGQGDTLVDRLIQDLASFTGPGYEQEDDITLLVVGEAGPGGAA